MSGGRTAGRSGRRAYLGIGSNLGDRGAFLQSAVDALGRVDGVQLVAVSPVYETRPIGGPPQPDFLNAVVAVETDLTPRQLLELAHRIEAAAARVRAEHWGPRTLDVDVLLVGDEQVDEPDLVIPHPRMTERAFVMVPLADVAPEWRSRVPADAASVRPAGLALSLPE